MKINCIIAFFICCISTLSFSQTVSKPLDGKRYSIQMYVGKEKDSNEVLTFSNGVMNFMQSTKYGFSTDEYKCKQKNDSTFTFLTVSKSKKNGVMTWEGKVVNEKIEGTCIWTRNVENPVNYTFKGGLIKDK